LTDEALMKLRPVLALLPLVTALATLAACSTMTAPGAPGDDGLIALKSPHGAADTMARLEAQVKQRGLAVFARIDHAAGAARTGQTLRPTELLIFGSPQTGTPLMQCAQRAGIDLPMKALAWTDAQGQTWLGYNEPQWLLRRHGSAECAAAEAVGKALASLAQAAVAP
jgi:uncharacterized protein (DUF302 family)